MEGKQHPDRDAQFRHINDTARRYLKAGHPDVSVDTKKKKLVGEHPGYKNNGREYQPKGKPVRVGVHDFPDPAMPKAVPYGVYDLAADTGTDGDTAPFTVETLRRGWTTVGQARYPKAKRLFITANAGLTATESGSGNANSPSSPTRPGWPSPSTTSHPKSASGTSSNTACSHTSS